MQRKDIIKKLSVLGMLLVLAACEKASDTLVNIPSVGVTCTTAENTECDATVSGNDVFVIMTRSGCSNADFEPVASGSATLSCDGSGCEGLVSTWVDKNQSGVDQILTGRMDICSYIDVDDNANEGTGDLGNTSSESIQSSGTITVDNWSTL